MDIESVTTWIDISVLESELSGVLLVLIELWLLVGLRTLSLRSLEARCGETVGAVQRTLALHAIRLWRPRIRLDGEVNGVKVRVEWSAPWGHEAVSVRVDAPAGRRDWRGEITLDSASIIGQVRRLVGAPLESDDDEQALAVDRGHEI